MSFILQQSTCRPHSLPHSLKAVPYKRQQSWIHTALFLFTNTRCWDLPVIRSVLSFSWLGFWVWKQKKTLHRCRLCFWFKSPFFFSHTYGKHNTVGHIDLFNFIVSGSQGERRSIPAFIVQWWATPHRRAAHSTGMGKV